MPMHYKVLADRTRYFTKDKEDVAGMCKVMEDMLTENKKEIAISFIKEGSLPLEKIAACIGFTIEEIKEFAQKETA